MRLLRSRDGRDQIGLSATDLTRHVACRHLTQLDLAATLGEIASPPPGTDDALELVLARGTAHETDHLERLRARGLGVVEIDERLDLHEREAQTIEAMRAGVDVIYQATLLDGPWVGHADFLTRRDLALGEEPSALGRHVYDLADTKLARSLKVTALLQMAVYAERLGQIQGQPPRDLVVVTGDGHEHVWALRDVQAYARRRRAELEHDISERPATEPVPCAHCSQCRWAATCAQQWQDADDLSLVAGMRGQHRADLHAAGVTTLAGLAASDPAELQGVLTGPVARRLVAQARLQLHERETGETRFELLEPEAGRGLQALPEPSEHDLYLDFEGDPFACEGRGLEYLAGLCDRTGEFEPRWAHTEAGQGAMVADLLTRLVQHRRAHPGAHVYHYASYEVDRLKSLTGRFGVAEGELDELLRAGAFVDLYTVVKQGVRISKGSYSIKKLEAFYWGRTRGGQAGAGEHPSSGAAPFDPFADPFGAATVATPTDEESEAVSDGLGSVVAYERWVASRREGPGGELDDGDVTLLEAIAAYNHDDVLSTRDLHDWLEARRGELDAERAAAGLAPLSRPVLLEQRIIEESETQRTERELSERLVAAGHPLMAALVGYHRREERPVWWALFRTGALDDAALVDDATTLGGLGQPELVGEVSRSNIWRYRFEPQRTGLRVGDAAHDVTPDAQGMHPKRGEVVGLDAAEGWVDLKIGKKTDPPQLRGLTPHDLVATTGLREALQRRGEDLLAGRATLAAALLEGQVPPALTEVVNAEEAADRLLRVGGALDGTVLAVQGPPGAGKTYTATRLVHALVDAGLTVGITSSSHAALQNLLLRAVARDAGTAGEGERPSAVVKVSSPPAELARAHPHVRFVTQNPPVAAALDEGVQVVGGTAWLFVRPELEGRLDVLIVDEASQVGLATAVAMAGSARSMVLLGDPQQLGQVVQGTHPAGADASVLGHLIGEHDVVPTERGVFLDRTWRMHPQITGFVSDLAYAGQLGTAPGRERHEVLSAGPLHGSGLRWVPVEHEHRSTCSPEEAEVVAGLVAGLLADGVFTDYEGTTRRMTGGDVLVVAAYNAQADEVRHALAERLGEEQARSVEVGSVDRFQGREAPAVIYTMGSSTAADAPRGTGFLFDVNRFTVALSRAQALAVVVGSPSLPDAVASTPASLRGVNALARFVEIAERVEP